MGWDGMEVAHACGWCCVGHSSSLVFFGGGLKRRVKTCFIYYFLQVEV